jgi:DNA-binding SARP family transcriptional activator
LWPDSPEPRAAACLRTSLWRLRRIDVVLAEQRDQWLALPGDATVDVVDFAAWATRLREVETVPDDDLDVTGVPRGDILPEWSDCWIVLERERLHQLRLWTLDTLAGELIRREQPSAAAEAAQAAVEIDPLRESSARLLIEAHLRRDDVVAAVRRFEVFSRLLRDELGISPSAGLRALVDGGVRRGRATVHPRVRVPVEAG